MDDMTMRSRFVTARVAHLATISGTDRPHVVPCCFAVDGDTVYSAVDGKPKSTRALQRVTNLRANPRATLLVDHYDEDWTLLWWVRIDAHGRVLDRGAEFDNAVTLLRAKYEQYRRDAPAGPVVALDILTWLGWP
jgi:PPOX class probable F420-dependent enzyme